MFVACSTLCFSRLSLEEALDVIAELEFSKFEAGLDEQGCQLRPSEVAADIGRVASRLRHGPGLTPAAFSLNLDDASNAEYDRQFKAVCRLARISSVPIITIKAAAVDTMARAHFVMMFLSPRSYADDAARTLSHRGRRINGLGPGSGLAVGWYGYGKPQAG